MKASNFIMVAILAIIGVTQVNAQPQRPDKEEVFAKLDVSKDGKLDKEEFIAGAEKRKEMMKEKHDSKKVFEKIDEDQNGAIEYDEFRKAGEERQERREKRPSPEQLFEKIDTDKDGFISMAEFKAHKRPEEKR